MKAYTAIIISVLIVIGNTGMADARLVQDWASYYGGDIHGADDYAKAVAIGPSGNVYVIGHVNDLDMIGSSIEEGMIVAYDNDGHQLWEKELDTLHAWDIICDGDENLYTMSGAGLIKFDRYGNELWRSLRWKEYAGDVTVDTNGYVYVAATVVNLSTTDFITIKYSGDGTVLWEATYTASVTSREWSPEVIVDDLGNVYVAGETREPGSEEDMAIVAYDQWGHRIWHELFDGISVGEDYPTAMVSNGSNLYVAGVSNDDFVTIAFDATGIMQWFKMYDSPDHGIDRTSDIAIDSVGNIYVSGFCRGTMYKTMTTISYDERGNLRWIQRLDNSGYKPSSLVCDREHELIYVCGESDTYSPLDADIVTVAYNLNGIKLFTKYFDGPNNKTDFPVDMQIDDDGNIYITGCSRDGVDEYSDDDYVTIKYSYLPDPMNRKRFPKKVPWPEK